MSSFSVASTPTVAAFAANSLPFPFHKDALGSADLSETSFNKFSFTLRVVLMRSTITSLSKFAFVIVVKRLRVIR